MKIKIVTDSTSDLPAPLVSQLGVTVVPSYVHFGNNVYRDRVDISEEEFYERLRNGPVHPHTEPPTPMDFAESYRRLLGGAEGIISIHISSKLSATCNSARRGRELAGKNLPIEVIDSQLVTMGLGLLVIAAAAELGPSAGLAEAAAKVRKTIPAIHMLGLMDTLKYLARGGRIGRVKALLGTALRVKPMLTIKDGELEPAGTAGSRADGIERLRHFIGDARGCQDMAIVHSTTPEEACGLARKVKPDFPADIKLARLGPVLGTHAGPGGLFAAVRMRL